MTTRFSKNDAGKPPFALLPPRALREVAKVMGFGADKYTAHNWRQDDAGYTRIANAALRHIFDWLDHKETDLDPESGLSHLAHACCNLLFLLSMEVNQRGIDDRYREEPDAKVGSSKPESRVS